MNSYLSKKKKKKKVLLVLKKLCQAKIGPFGKKLFFDFFALKKPKIAFCRKLEHKDFSEKLF
jgi:hypothetical protein